MFKNFSFTSFSCSFILLKTILYISIFLISLLSLKVHAQSLQGIVFDERTKQRIAKVQILNTRTGELIFNNLRGEFELSAQQGDLLVSTAQGYFTDSTLVKDNAVLLIRLKRESIYIDEVSIIAKQSPEEILKKRQEEYEKAFRLAEGGDAFSIGPNGAGLSINWLYSLFSKEVKNAKRLKNIIERDYREDMIDYKFTKELVNRTTGLTGNDLLNFMHTFRPSYDFILTADDYQLSQYIKSKFVQYKRNPRQYRIQALPKIDFNIVD